MIKKHNRSLRRIYKFQKLKNGKMKITDFGAKVSLSPIHWSLWLFLPVVIPLLVKILSKLNIFTEFASYLAL